MAVVLTDTTHSSTRYEPGRIVDVFPDTMGGMFIADAAFQQIVRVNATGEVLDRYGRKGHGPAEFVDVQAVAVRGGKVFALDADGSVSIFAVSGQYLKDVRTWHQAQDIAVLPNGDLAVASEVRAFGMETEGVILFDSAGNQKRVLVRRDNQGYGERPFTGPAGTRIRVFAGEDGRLAAAYLTDNSVDVFAGGDLVAQIRGCVPSAVQAYYRRLYDHNARSSPAARVQSVRFMINAVYLDENGDILVGEPGGWDNKAHITTYDHVGRPKRVLRFDDANAAMFAVYAVFINRENLLAWDGGVFRWRVAPGAR